MADNSHLFKARSSKSTYKREDPSTVVTTIRTSDKAGYQAVVLVQQGKLYTPVLFEVYDTRVDALQRAHYINANYILRSNVDPMPLHAMAGDDTLAGLREKGYAV